MDLDPGTLTRGRGRPGDLDHDLLTRRSGQGRRDADCRIADGNRIEQAHAALLPDAGSQQIGVLGQRQERRDPVVRAHRNIPASFERPGHDGFAQMSRRRAELRRGNCKRRFPCRARLEARGHRGLEKRVRDEQLARRLHPAIGGCDVAVRVAMVLGAPDFVEPEADEAQVRLPRRDLFRGGDPDPAGDPHAHDGRVIEDDLTSNRAVRRAQKLLGANVVQRMAAGRAGKPRPVQRVEGGGGGSAVAERSKTEVERHRETSSVTENSRRPARAESA